MAIESMQWSRREPLRARKRRLSSVGSVPKRMRRDSMTCLRREEEKMAKRKKKKNRQRERDAFLPVPPTSETPRGERTKAAAMSSTANYALWGEERKSYVLLHP